MRLGNDDEVASFDADDIEQVADHPAHARGVALDELGIARDLARNLVATLDVHERGRAQGQAAEHVPQIVAHDCEEVVSRADLHVSTLALDTEKVIGLIALES